MDKVKTTINIDTDLWRKFSIKVINAHGGRHKSDIIEEFIRKYLDGPNLNDSIEELIEKHLKESIKVNNAIQELIGEHLEEQTPQPNTIFS